MTDERDTRRGAFGDDGEDSAAARPSGKRSARRGRSGSSSADTGSIATIDRPVSTRKATTTSGRAERGGSRNPFTRLIKFLREVIAELRKVIWPNRKQMITYTTVVLVFVTVMVAYISGLDLAFIKGVDWLFG